MPLILLATLAPPSQEFALVAGYSVIAAESFDGKATRMGTYEIDTTIELVGTFANSETGAPADPTTVTLRIRQPDGTVLTKTGSDLTRTAAGNFSFLITVQQSGIWTYKWQGVGTVVATSPDTQFTVKPSILIAG